MQIINPYPGLRPFTEEESIFFKGREVQIERITARLQEKRFLMVNGASGDGKSSLIYAGLIPNAKAGFFKARYNNWLVADFRPERSPLRNLTHSLCRQLKLNDEAGIEKELGYGFSALCDIYTASPYYIDEESQPWQQADEAERKKLKRKGANLLILADQFEEFFTNPENYHNGTPSIESQKTVNLLLETYRIAQERNLPIYVVCTMRSDYIGQCAAFRGMPEAIGYSQFFVPRLTRMELEQVIEGPAQLAGGTVSKRLVQVLLNSLKDGFDQLPILQHALNRLWKLADDGQQPLDLIHLAKAGGLSERLLPLQERNEFKDWLNAQAKFKQSYYRQPSLNNIINASANELYETAHERYRQQFGETLDSATTKRIIRHVFICLTKIDNSRAVRSRMSAREIADLYSHDNIQPELIDKLMLPFRTEGNTYVYPFVKEEEEWQALSAEQTLDITHESLIRNWKQLSDWAEEEDNNVQTYHDFAKQLERWQSHERSKGFLLPIGALTYFEQWFGQLNPNAFWIRRYENFETTPEQALTQSVEKLQAAKDFIRLSARNLFASRFVMKHGANKIAAVVGIIIMLSAITFYYFDFRKKQNEVVLENTIQQGIEFLSKPKIHATSKAKFIIAHDRLLEAQKKEFEYVKLLNQIEGDTNRFDVMVQMIQQLNTFEEWDTLPYNHSGHYSLAVFESCFALFKNLVQDKLDLLDKNANPNIDVDRVESMLASSMYMKLGFNSNERVQIINKEVSALIRNLLLKTILVADFEKAGLSSNGFHHLLQNLFAVDDYPDYRNLIAAISPFENNETIHQKFKTLFKDELHNKSLNVNQKEYYEALAMLYATEIDNNASAPMYVYTLIDSVTKFAFGSFGTDEINLVILRYSDNPLAHIKFINTKSKDISGFNDQHYKDNYWYELCKALIDQHFKRSFIPFPKFNKCLYFIKENNKELLWNEAGRIFLSNQSVEGKFETALYYKFRGYYLARVKNRNADKYFEKAIQTYSSIPGEMIAKEFENKERESSSDMSATYKLFWHELIGYLKYNTIENLFATESYNQFFIDNSESPFYAYLIRNQREEILASPEGFKVLEFTIENTKLSQTRQTNQLLTKIHPLNQSIELSKNYQAKLALARMDQLERNEDFPQQVRKLMMEMPLNAITDKNIILDIAFDLSKRNQLSLADSLISKIRTIDRTEAYFRMCMKLSDHKLDAELIYFLNKAIKSQKEEHTHYSPEFFRLLGRMGGKSIQNFALNEIKNYPEIGKAVAISKYGLGLMEAGKYYQAKEFTPMLNSDGYHFEKCAIMLHVEAMRLQGIDALNPKDSRWNDASFFRYIYNADSYFSNKN
jgi:hypothetical protein